jgi:type IV secretory pathway TrbL component
VQHDRLCWSIPWSRLDAIHNVFLTLLFEDTSMKKSLLLASLIASIALAACGKKEEVAVEPASEAAVMEAASEAAAATTEAVTEAASDAATAVTEAASDAAAAVTEAASEAASN